MRFPSCPSCPLWFTVFESPRDGRSSPPGRKSSLLSVSAVVQCIRRLGCAGAPHAWWGIEPRGAAHLLVLRQADWLTPPGSVHTHTGLDQGVSGLTGFFVTCTMRPSSLGGFLPSASPPDEP